MKSLLFSALLTIGAITTTKAQIAQNLVLFPSPTTMYSPLNVQYDLYNNTANPISGVVSTAVKINSVYKGVMNTYTLSSPLLPAQSISVSFSINVSPTDFALGNNIIIVFPTGDNIEGNGGEAVSTAYIIQHD